MSSDASSNAEEEHENSEERSRVFQAKVIELVQPRKSYDDDDDDDEGACLKRIKLDTTEVHKVQENDEYHRERDALEIQRRHKQFIDTQAKKAEQHVKKMMQLVTVSSKRPVVDSVTQRPPGMEGKGPRVVPQSVKNHRKRLKKKATKH
jgi:hypothetical protein